MSWYSKYYTIGGEISSKEKLEELLNITRGSELIAAIIYKDTLEYEAESDDSECDYVEDLATDWFKNVENTDTEHCWTEWRVNGKSGSAEDDDNCRMSKDELLRLVDESKELHGHTAAEALIHLNNDDAPLLKQWAHAVSNGSKTPELDALRATLDQVAHSEPKAPALSPLSVTPELMAWLQETYADDIREIEEEKAAKEEAKKVKEAKEAKKAKKAKASKKAK